MTTTFKVRDTAIWMPTNWIYEAVIDYIISGVNNDSVVLLKLLKEGLEDPISFCDLQPLEMDEFPNLLVATEKGLDYCTINWLSNHDNLKAYFAIISAFSELKTLIRTDPRNTRNENLSCTITFNGEVNFVTESWMYDLILEHLAAYVRREDSILAANLYTARTHLNERNCDLSKIGHEKKQLFSQATNYLYDFYVGKPGSLSYAPEVFAKFTPAVNKFVEIVQSISKV